MTNRTIYTRAYSTGSAGQLVSAKGPRGDPLSNTALLEEFRKHANKQNRHPTALVSGSDRIVDTLKRAFHKHYRDAESPANIWIVFIEVPDTITHTINGTATRIHAAKKLAEKCEFPEPNLFSHEVVFEWAIPEKYVLHKVSLRTLIQRGLQEHYFCQGSTADVRDYAAREFQQDDPWEIGLSLGFFARNFGARAPLDWVSHQLFHDCIRARIVGDDVVKLNYAHGHTEIVDFQFFCELEDGISTSLNDWWLSDIDFFLNYEEFKEWRDMTKDSMTSDLIEFWETWHDANCDGTVKELSEKEKVLYNEAKHNLYVKHRMKRAAIEARAVEIGL